MLTEEQFKELGMLCGKPITEGPYKDTWMAVRQYYFTWGLQAGVDMFGYSTRYCYANFIDCLQAFCEWNGVGDPPGPWIKQKPQERLGPGAKPPVEEEEPIRMIEL